MFSNITQDISTTEYQGLEIFEVAGTLHYALMKLQQKQGELELSGAWSSTALEDIATHIKPKNALLLQINTSRVLNKQLDGDRPALAEQWVKKAFPNLDLEQFRYQVMDGPKIKLVSISKRSVVEEHLTELKALGLVPTKRMMVDGPFLQGSLWFPNKSTCRVCGCPQGTFCPFPSFWAISKPWRPHPT